MSQDNFDDTLTQKNANTQTGPFSISNKQTSGYTQQSPNTVNPNPNPQPAYTGRINNNPTPTPMGTPQKEKPNLTPEEIAYLESIGDQNYYIKKTIKKTKKGYVTANARRLRKVRRLYSARIWHRYYFFQFRQVARLRALLGANKKSAAVLFGAAARKTRNLVASLIIMFTILAVIGAGSFVTLMVIGNDPNKAIDENGFTFTFIDQESVPTSIEDYVLGRDMEYPVNFINKTGKTLQVRFRIIFDEGSNTELAAIMAENDISKTDFIITYQYSQAAWRLDDNGWLYSRFPITDSSTELPIISGFNIDLPPEKNSNIFAGHTATLTLKAEFGEIDA